MPIDPTTTNPSIAEVSNELYTTLLAGADFTLPTGDVSGTAYTVPSETNNPLYQANIALTEAMLTTREMGGTGLFDGLMQSMGAHLKTEYEKGRITGKEYAESWVQSMSAALGNAVQYLLQKDNSYYQATLIKMQARAAEAAVVSERIRVELQKTQLASARIEALNASANYAATKIRLATEKVNFELANGELEKMRFTLDELMPKEAIQLDLQNDRLSFEINNLLPQELLKAEKAVEALTAEIQATGAKVDQMVYETSEMLPAQKAQVEAGTSKITYEVTNLLPQELDKGVAELGRMALESSKLYYELEEVLPVELEKSRMSIQQITTEIAVSETQKGKLDFELTNLLPLEEARGMAQNEQITLQNDKLSFENDFLLPKELEKSVKQVEVMSAEISSAAAKTDQIVYETASILPAQRDKLDAETAISVYQLSDRLPAEVASLAADTAGKLYNNTWILPAQLESLREQTEGHRSRTMDTRTDGAPILGSVGVQNKLQEEQVNSFKRDAETKVVKMLLDTWITQKSMDEGLPPPSSLTDTNLNSAVTGLRTKVGL